jgi:hypothetical protein
MLLAIQLFDYFDGLNSFLRNAACALKDFFLFLSPFLFMMHHKPICKY